MPWGHKRAVYDLMWVQFYDRDRSEALEIQRSVEQYQGYHSMGRISYRGERLKLYGDRYAEDYPPPLHRCRTAYAQQWWAHQQAGTHTTAPDGSVTEKEQV